MTGLPAFGEVGFCWNCDTDNVEVWEYPYQTHEAQWRRERGYRTDEDGTPKLCDYCRNGLSYRDKVYVKPHDAERAAEVAVVRMLHVLERRLQHDGESG